MNVHEKLNYVEFAARDLAATKTFSQAVFGWQFVDYGPDYCAFADEELDGGFYRADQCNQTAQGGALLVFYSANIEATQAKVSQHGGTINRPLFDFPGGRRFHFVEPSSNIFTVLSESGDE